MTCITDWSCFVFASCMVACSNPFCCKPNLGPRVQDARQLNLNETWLSVSRNQGINAKRKMQKSKEESILNLWATSPSLPHVVTVCTSMYRKLVQDLTWFGLSAMTMTGDRWLSNCPISRIQHTVRMCLLQFASYKLGIQIWQCLQWRQFPVKPCAHDDNEKTKKAAQNFADSEHLREWNIVKCCHHSPSMNQANKSDLTRQGQKATAGKETITMPSNQICCHDAWFSSLRHCLSAFFSPHTAPRITADFNGHRSTILSLFTSFYGHKL